MQFLLKCLQTVMQVNNSDYVPQDVCKIKAHLSGTICESRKPLWQTYTMRKISLKLRKFSSWYLINSMDLELGNMCKLCNSFLVKVRESKGTWVQKKPERVRELCLKIGLNPWRGDTQFFRTHSGKIAFSKSKLANLKSSKGYFQKSIYVFKHLCLDFFW